MERSTPAHRKTLNAAVRARCEARPGTYRMLARDGQVLYVGQSRALRTRLLSYFRVKGGRSKQRRILRHTFALEWEYTTSEFAALLAELRLIKQHRPVFNRSLVDDEWPGAYVALTGGPVPGLRVLRRTDDPNAESLWGPFRNVTRLAEAVRALAELTGVRDCALDAGLAFAADPQQSRRKPGCLRVELGTCVGPCIGSGQQEPYYVGVAAARAFLEARCDAPLQIARRRMQEAAEALRFESAGAWRDKAARVAWLDTRLRSFRANMDRLTFRYLDRGVDGSRHVYMIRRGTVRAVVPAPNTPAESTALDTLARRVFLASASTEMELPSHELEEFHLVASWFRRRPQELAHTAPGVVTQSGA